jgi:hypothetical protein
MYFCYYLFYHLLIYVSIGEKSRSINSGSWSYKSSAGDMKHKYSDVLSQHLLSSKVTIAVLRYYFYSDWLPRATRHIDSECRTGNDDGHIKTMSGHECPILLFPVIVL